MNKSDSIVKISSALAKAQKNIGSAVKGTTNPFFRSQYANLGAVMEACKEALNDQGITILQPVMSDETGTYVETMLLHESGEWLSGRMRVLEGKNMQEIGSGVSYARRYGLQSMVFIPQEDDDGNAVSGKNADAPKKAPAKATSPDPAPKVADPSPKDAEPVKPPEVQVTKSPTPSEQAGKIKPNFKREQPVNNSSGGLG